MDIKTIPGKAMKYIALHHSGGLGNDYYASTRHLVASQIDNAHKNRWSRKYPNFISSLGFWGGYNFWVNDDGSWVQFRAIGEETGAQLGHNLDTVSIGCAGNWMIKNGIPVNVISPAAKKTVIEIMEWVRLRYPIKLVNIKPHRLLQIGRPTACYGTVYKDSFARNLLIDKPPTPVPFPVPISDKGEQLKILTLRLTILRLMLKIQMLIRDKARRAGMNLAGLFAPRFAGIDDKYHGDTITL